MAGQPHSSASLYLGKEPLVPTEWGPHQSECFWTKGTHQLLPGIEPWTTQPVVSLYTDYAILGPVSGSRVQNIFVSALAVSNMYALHVHSYSLLVHESNF